MDRTGRCVNFGNCTTANQKQTIIMPSGLELKCPECGRSLVEIQQTNRSGAGIAAVFVMALALLGAAGWFLWNNLRSPAKGQQEQRSGDGETVVPSDSAKAMLRLRGSNTIGESWR